MSNENIQNVNAPLTPLMDAYTHPLKKAERKILGRNEEIKKVLAGLMRPELCNVMLLGEPGAGKTALVQAVMLIDTASDYIEVDLSKMIADCQTDVNEMAAKLKTLFDEVENVIKTTGRNIVLFIDEFHQIVQLSPAAVEALKPLLADSGTRGIKVIAATTYREFREYISANQPLVERLQRINVAEPSEEVVISILRGMAKRYSVDQQFQNDDLFKLIYDLTNQYIPANAQPRKSILILDAMIGWYRAFKKPLDRKLLEDVFLQAENVSVSTQVDATNIAETLKKRVLAQELAVSAIEQRLHIAIADMTDDTKPKASFLFTGSTGVGKTEMTKQMAKLLFNDERRLIRFDMTEFANPSSMERFRRELTSQIWTRPYSIVLLDEIEKACAEVTRLLLGVLDDGRLLDENNREVTFNNAYIVLTTNAASEIYQNIAQYQSSDTGDGAVMRKYDALIRRSITSATGANKFPPELLGRIDCIVPFQPLSEQTQMNITRMRLDGIKKKLLDKHDVKMTYTEDVITYLVKDTLTTDSNSGGARAIMNKLNTEVVSAISEYINKNPNAKRVGVAIGGEMASEDKYRLESAAYVKVGPI